MISVLSGGRTRARRRVSRTDRAIIFVVAAITLFALFWGLTGPAGPRVIHRHHPAQCFLTFPGGRTVPCGYP